MIAEGTLQPRPRRDPEIPPVDAPPERFRAAARNAEQITVTDVGYLIEVTVPARFTNSVVARLHAHAESVVGELTAHRHPARTTFSGQAETAVAALAVLDVLLSAEGRCRVCGAHDCLEGIVYTDADKPVHRSEAELPDHPDARHVTTPVTDMAVKGYAYDIE